MSNINTLLPSLNKRVSAAIESLDNLSTDIEKKVQQYAEQRASSYPLSNFSSSLPSTFVNLLPIIGTVGTSNTDSHGALNEGTTKKRSRIEELVVKYSNNEDNGSSGSSSSSSAWNDSSSFSSSSPAVCRPWSRTDYLQRLHTYRPSTFTLNKYYEYASPLQCSRYGYVNQGSPNLLCCTWCKQSFALPLYSPRNSSSSSSSSSNSSSNNSVGNEPSLRTATDDQSSSSSSSSSSSLSTDSSSSSSSHQQRTIAQYYHTLFRSHHDNQCPWKDLACPIEFATVPVKTGKLYTNNFILRLHGITNTLQRSLRTLSNASTTTTDQPLPSSTHHQWRLHPLCIPDIIVTLTSHKDTINRLTQITNPTLSDTTNNDSSSSSDAVTVLKHLCLLVLWYQQITSSSSSSPSSSSSSLPLSISSLNIMDLLQLPELLPFLLSLYGWQVASSSSSSSSSSSLSESNAGKRRRSSVSSLVSLASVKSNEGKTESSSSSIHTLQCVVCDRCIHLDDILRKDTRNSSSAANNVPNDTSSTVTHSALQAYRERVHHPTPHANKSSSSSSTVTDNTTTATTVRPRRSLMDAVKSAKAAASKAISTFTTLSSISNANGTLSSSPTHSTSLTPSTVTGNTIHYLHPANEHAWYCPYARNLTTLPHESFATLVQSTSTVWKPFIDSITEVSVDTTNDTARYERLRKLLFTEADRTASLSSSSSSVSLTFTPISILQQTMMNTNGKLTTNGGSMVVPKVSSPSSSFADLYRLHHSTVPAAVASGLASLGLAAVGVTDIDTITKLLIKAAEEQLEDSKEYYRQQQETSTALSSSSSSVTKDDEDQYNRTQIAVIKQLRFLLQQNTSTPENEDISLDSLSMLTTEQDRKSSFVLSYPMPGWLFSVYTLYVSLN